MKDLVNDDVRLVAATIELLHAEATSSAELARLIGVAPPPSWPPEHNDDQTRAWIEGKLRDQANDGWLSYYVIARYDGHDTLAGIARYTGNPDQSLVEIGYSIIPEMQRRGIAAKAVTALCRKAFADPAVNAVTANTLPELLASQGVLRKLGFAKVGETSAEGQIIWNYRLDRR